MTTDVATMTEQEQRQAQELAAKKRSAEATARIRAATGIESYRDGYYRLFAIVNLLALIMFCLTVLNIYVAYTYHPENGYFAENSEGKRRPLVGLTEPNINRESLMIWVSSAATQVMTIGFSDYDTRLWEARALFTPDGWLKFAPAVLNSKTLQTITSSQQIMTAIPESPPTILEEGVKKGKYTWVMEIPLLLSIRAGEVSSTELMTVQLEIVKMPTSEMPSGLGINLWTSR